MSENARQENPVSLLARREIEAQIALPLFNALIRKTDRETAFAILREVIAALARETGARIARELGGDSLEHLQNGIIAWTEEDALEMTILEQNESVFAFDVTRCRFTEMYRRLGIPPELGVILSCSRDFAWLDGFNPRITLNRSQTIMEGAQYCDFRYTGDASRPR